MGLTPIVSLLQFYKNNKIKNQIIKPNTLSLSLSLNFLSFSHQPNKFRPNCHGSSTISKQLLNSILSHLAFQAEDEEPEEDESGEEGGGRIGGGLMKGLREGGKMKQASSNTIFKPDYSF